METEFELDLEVIEKQGSTTTSLGSQYGYPVFSEEFQEAVKRKKREEKEEKTAQMHQVFEGTKKTETEATFQRVMRAETVGIVKEESIAEVEGRSLTENLGFALLGALLTGGILYLIDKRLKKGKKSHEYQDNH
ncbi:hypothetical protein M2454_002456 [Aequitasia blattaphilus]|uniref:ESAT-6 secretion machinery protein EssA n=1 Tax=Aequitasia blattaphilus TaxID=2949332 RepID=A0ABT1EB55_9FIRM|nr:hypothetical protein [Aequitasia blattaphilus]MCP1103066.1 hypothetical protein [Aequitasia blattaphilus]MCR8615706.1 hypothetical protein [Aequitasia blattaphilus]